MGGGESSGLALMCGSVAVVVALWSCGSVAVVVVLWCQAVHVAVVVSSSGCHVASCDVAPLVGVNEEAGRGAVLLTWAGHDVAAVIVMVALWRALNGGGGWVVSLMLVVVGRKKQRCGNV